MRLEGAELGIPDVRKERNKGTTESLHSLTVATPFWDYGGGRLKKKNQHKKQEPQDYIRHKNNIEKIIRKEKNTIQGTFAIKTLFKIMNNL